MVNSACNAHRSGHFAKQTDFVLKQSEHTIRKQSGNLVYIARLAFIYRTFEEEHIDQDTAATQAQNALYPLNGKKYKIYKDWQPDYEGGSSASDQCVRHRYDDASRNYVHSSKSSPYVSSQLAVDGKIISSIGKGLLVLVGIDRCASFVVPYIFSSQ